MAKGIPVIGRAPDKKAKIINVDELGNLKVSQLESKLVALEQKLTDGSQKVTLSGTIMELYGATIDERPPANSVPVGATFMAVKTQEVWQSDGTDWVVM